MDEELARFALTERSRRAVVLARDEARRLGHDRVGPEHLLLGVLREGRNVAAQSLVSLGITLDRAREVVESVVDRGGESEPEERSPTAPLEGVVELARREARRLGHDYTGTEHLLLGLAAEPGGVAERVLFGLGAEPEKIRREVWGRLGRER